MTDHEQPSAATPVMHVPWRRVARFTAVASGALIVAAIAAMLLGAVVLGQRTIRAMPSLVMLALGLGGLLAVAATTSALRRVERVGVDPQRELERRPELAAGFAGATGLLALALTGIAFGTAMVALTGNPRSALPLALGAAVALGALMLLRRATRSLRAASTAALG
ncbi:hypothetical protein L332_02800 [Agrococcus pavilionensis RW1]|uniref:Uncharacterized protein n=1 Tax=Agrococcus pavilionensis RW1 TaxID=1330458 RepID=U1MRU4_9MICO|nr:hypothetical protein [Agrococcus pavilionensis]ERG63380.1 hypothetical protein L332_02800 [Agrococcus pavilionensis RW1]